AVVPVEPGGARAATQNGIVVRYNDEKTSALIQQIGRISESALRVVAGFQYVVHDHSVEVWSFQFDWKGFGIAGKRIDSLDDRPPQGILVGFDANDTTSEVFQGDQKIGAPTTDIAYSRTCGPYGVGDESRIQGLAAIQPPCKMDTGSVEKTLD